MPEEVVTWESHDIEDHCALIARQVDRSLKDPETRRLAVKIVAGKADDWLSDGGRRVPVIYAWGEPYVLPDAGIRGCRGKDDVCEITLIWNFLVANVRYVLDPDGYDLFCTVKNTLEAGSGDCDDFTICFGALLRALGFANVAARVVSTDGRRWEHVYAYVTLPKTGRARKVVPLDPTVSGAVPGWEYPNVTDRYDYRL